MADSEDEFDRRNNGRDKFRPERSDYERRESDRRPPPPATRENWEERASWASRSRGDRRDAGSYRDFDRTRRRFSPPHPEAGGSPPHMKRMRGEWEDGAFPRFDLPPYCGPIHGPPPPPMPGGWGPPMGGDLPPPPHFGGNLPGPRGMEMGPLTQPPMMNFKHFLNSQDDNITDEDAIKRYGEYKTDFKRHQISEFFLHHKEEEWFKYKYHPEEYNRNQEETRKLMEMRCKVFARLLELNRVEAVPLDTGSSENLIRLLDAAVILMEGGTEFDLKAIDGPSNNKLDSTANHDVLKMGGDARSSPIHITFDGKRERKASLDAADGAKEDPAKLMEVTSTKSPIRADNDQPSLQKKSSKSGGGDKADGELSESESGSISDSDDEAPVNSVKNGTGTSLNKDGSGEAKDALDADAPEEGEERDEPKPRGLHKTLSIFLRNLAPTVTKQEIEEVCRRFPGFLRLALQDPQADRKFTRQGWVTFDRSVNIKEICWNLQSIKIKECELGAIVNADLKQRIRYVNGVTGYRVVARQDIKHAAKIIRNCDDRWKLWSDATDEKKDKEKEIGCFASRNPILKNITDYLVEEGSYEEEALLGKDAGDGMVAKVVNEPETLVDRDRPLLKVLDRMLLYLRIVHSLDYYSAIEYPDEDKMPNRCGIMHARSALPTEPVNPTEVADYMSSFQLKITPFLDAKLTLSDAEMIKFGKKDTEQEVEKFILANTQEVAKDKWMCPLSGKKFKGPDFVRKHIIAKHMEKVDEVKQEVSYFNNYLMDPKRPELPEHPSAAGRALPPPPRDGHMPPGSFHGGPLPPPHMGGYRPPGPPPGPGMYPGPPPGRRGAPGPFPNRGGPESYRGEYRAPPPPRDNMPPRDMPSRDLPAPPRDRFPTESR